jgi:RNA recognition motif-containing protein
MIEGVSVGTRIYVGNLPYSSDSEQLSQLFSAFGEVVDARVITDRNTGRSKGFGFVEMATEDQARSAIAGLNGTLLGDRTLRVDEAGERPAGGGRSGGYGDRSDRGGYSRGDRW